MRELKKPKFKRIIPFKKKCRCGKKVKNHHFLCDECWGESAKRKYRAKRRKLLIPMIKRIEKRRATSNTRKVKE